MTEATVEEVQLAYDDWKVNGFRDYSPLFTSLYAHYSGADADATLRLAFEAGYDRGRGFGKSPCQ